MGSPVAVVSVDVEQAVDSGAVGDATPNGPSGESQDVSCMFSFSRRPPNAPYVFLRVQ